ncbi:unnamed protein product [Prorocentrum cordatum]|uniref:Uncharacterized protein n=1 Tax=Prorocentrum cordatum TaxID=2364126 RepID=A0ABN9XCU4_9DINO|nr:unnamed protein product [Polarella glacialis]
MRRVKVDLKEFFMSGAAAELARAAGLHLHGDFKLLVQRALLLLLSCQFVVSPRDPATRHQVIKGSGMGLIHGGDVADACLTNLTEQFFSQASLIINFQVWVYMGF